MKEYGRAGWEGAFRTVSKVDYTTSIEWLFGSLPDEPPLYTIAEKPFAQILRVYFNVKGELRKQQLFMVDNYLPQMGCFTSSLTWNLFFFYFTQIRFSDNFAKTPVQMYEIAGAKGKRIR